MLSLILSLPPSLTLSPFLSYPLLFFLLASFLLYFTRCLLNLFIITAHLSNPKSLSLSSNAQKQSL